MVQHLFKILGISCESLPCQWQNFRWKQSKCSTRQYEIYQVVSCIEHCINSVLLRNWTGTHMSSEWDKGALLWILFSIFGLIWFVFIWLFIYLFILFYKVVHLPSLHYLDEEIGWKLSISRHRTEQYNHKTPSMFNAEEKTLPLLLIYADSGNMFPTALILEKIVTLYSALSCFPTASGIPLMGRSHVCLAPVTSKSWDCFFFVMT